MGRKECTVHAPHSESRVEAGIPTTPPTARGPRWEGIPLADKIRLLIAGAVCLLSKMNQTLQKLGLNSAGVLGPHTTFLPARPPPCPPGPALLEFLLLAHQRQLAAAWAGQTDPMPWDRACWTLSSGGQRGTGGRLSWRTVSAGHF